MLESLVPAQRPGSCAGATLGVGALVHYGVTSQEGVVIAADSFIRTAGERPLGLQSAAGRAASC